MTKLLSIVVTYNGEKWIDKCFGSLINSSFSNEIYCIDNNSIDRTVELIKSKYPSVGIKKLESNIGFGQANNLGLAYAMENNFDYVLLINQDVFIQPDTIDRLIKVSEDFKEYGILSPVQLDGIGGRMDFRFSNYVNESSCNGFFSDLVLSKKLKSVYDLPFVNAAAWLMPINTVKMIGGFDPIFFHYGEDDNFCQRVNFHGLKVGIVPSAFIYHDRPQKLNEFYPFASIRDFDRFAKVKLTNVNQCSSSVSYLELVRKIKSSLYASIFSLDFVNIKRWFLFLRHLNFIKEDCMISFERNRVINKNLN